MKIIFDQAAKTAAMRWTAGLHQAQHSLRRFPPPPACMASGGNTARGAAEGEAAGILDQGHRLLVHADRVHLQQEPGRRLAAPLLSGSYLHCQRRLLSRFVVDDLEPPLYVALKERLLQI